MFTGLVEAVGRVAAVDAMPGGWRVRIATPMAAGMALGESVAVSGVCLTVVAADGDGFATEVGPETARVSTLGRLRPGDVVNLERALRADSRVGGHFVQGHVDGLGHLVAVQPDAEFTWMTFTFERAHAAWLIPKGAIAVDGVSLTVARLRETSFDAQIIPHTWNETSLSTLASGAPVNLEFDMIGKYVSRAVQLALDARGHRL